MALPYMPLYVADYFGDTQHLTCEQDGAYLRLLMCLWRRDGYLPFDHPQLARMTKLSPQKWASIWPILEPFFAVKDGQIFSPRLLRELEDAEVYLAQKRGASAKAHEAKRLKNNTASEPDGVPSTVTVTTRGLFEEESLPQVTQISASAAADTIWEATPMPCRRRSSKAALRTALQAAANRRKNLAVIIQAVEAYYADPDKAKQDYQYAKGVHRVIEADYWESWAPSTVVEHIDPDTELRLERQFFENWLISPDDAWAPPSWRPYPPGHPDCKIRPQVMREYGYEPGAEVTAEMRTMAMRGRSERSRRAG